MDALRIALALAVIKHTPPGCSSYAYILDLRASPAHLWRAHALALEKTCAALQGDLARAQINSLDTKKSKQKDASNQPSIARTLQPALPPALVASSLSVALDALHRAACARALPLDVFISAATRVIDEMAISVRTALCAGAPAHLLEPVARAMRRLAAEPAILVPAVLDRLLVDILTPPALAFLRLTEDWLAPLAAADPARGVDPRPGVLAFLQRAFACLEGASCEVRAGFALAVLRHLARILSADHLAAGAALRVRRVVVRETVWYICNALHAAIGLGSGAGCARQGCRVVGRAGRAAFVDILARQLNGNTALILDDSARRMLLVVFDLYEGH